MKIRVYVRPAAAIVAGKNPDPLQTIEVDLSQLTPEQRQELALTGQTNKEGDGSAITLDSGEATLEAVSATLTRMLGEREKAKQEEAARVEHRIQLLLQMSQDEVNRIYISFYTGDEDKKALQDPRLAGRAQARQAYLEAERVREQEECEADKLRLKEQKALAEAELRGRETKEAAEKETRLAERSAWVGLHGSTRIRKALAADYAYQRLYVEERAAQELPGFEVDFSNKLEWKERANPSEAALDLLAELKAKGFTAYIVWITSDVTEREVARAVTVGYVGYDDFTPYEAVAVREYLGKYDLTYATVQGEPQIEEVPAQ